MIQGNKEESYSNDIKPFQKSPDIRKITKNNFNNSLEKMKVISLKSLDEEDENDYNSPVKKTPIVKKNSMIYVIINYFK